MSITMKYIAALMLLLVSVIPANMYSFKQQMKKYKVNMHMKIENEKLVDSNNVVALFDENNYSFFKNKPSNKYDVEWHDVFDHVNERLQWESVNKANQSSLDNIFKFLPIQSLDSNSLFNNSIFLLIDIHHNYDMNVIDFLRNQKNTKSVICLNTSDELLKYEFYNEYNVRKSNFIMNYINKILKNRVYKDETMVNLVKDLYNRKSFDDLVFMIMILIDNFIKPIKSVISVTSTASTTTEQMKCMTSKCQKELISCLKDESCRKALNCLNGCKGNDQVCSYKCITSYESKKFQSFAYCILQKNNCMENSALIPVYPNPTPLQSFRREKVTWDVADDIFIGYLKTSNNNLIANNMLDWSWKVVCGANAAYDCFSCQHQIFYKDKGDHFWYDPVFKVLTLDNKEVWRRRHYRVIRDTKSLPGTYYFSVLDNGVKSNEWWKIIDADDDLQWALFYYSGAAAAAGTSYSGALIVTKDGNWPNMNDETYNRIKNAMSNCGIKLWEMYPVDNTNCDEDCLAGKPPLGIKSKIKVNDANVDNDDCNNCDL